MEYLIITLLIIMSITMMFDASGVGALGFACAIIIMLATAIVIEESVEEDAIEAGVAEYYIDSETNEKEFRFLTPITEETNE
jgi:urocanate hydratase